MNHFLNFTCQFRLFRRGELYIQSPASVSAPYRPQRYPNMKPCMDGSRDITVSQYHGSIGSGRAMKTIRVYRGANARQVGTPETYDNFPVIHILGF